MAELRHPTAEDAAALARVTLLTGDAGRDATPLFHQADLLGAIYALPYAARLPGWTWVAEDAEGIVGYVACAPDTVRFEADRDAMWFPAQLARMGDGDPASALEARLRSFLRTPEPTAAELTGPFPAHLHLNLLPRGRGAGLGRRLCETALAALCAQGVAGVHVGIDSRNDTGLAFWRRMGFMPVVGPPGAVWMGRVP